MTKNTILWAEDDADDLQMIREILQKNQQHFDIVEVRNGKEALTFLENSLVSVGLPCLIILDINMPVMDGKETLAIIKKTESYKSIPVVVFTTSESELDKKFCKKLNTEMFTKPPSYSNLESTLVKLLKFCNPD